MEESKKSMEPPLKMNKELSVIDESGRSVFGSSVSSGRNSNGSDKEVPNIDKDQFGNPPENHSSEQIHGDNGNGSNSNIQRIKSRMSKVSSMQVPNISAKFRRSSSHIGMEDRSDSKL